MITVLGAGGRPGALPLDPSKGGAFAILPELRVWGSWPQRVQGSALTLTDR